MSSAQVAHELRTSSTFSALNICPTFCVFHTMTERLSEEQVSDAFHGYLKSSLSHAKAERLLDTQMLSSAEADLMITGKLCTT